MDTRRARRIITIKQPLELLNAFRLRIIQRLLKLDLSQDIFLLVVASIVGVAAGYGAVIFHGAIELVRTVLFDQLWGMFKGNAWSPYFIVLLPAIGGLAVGILNKFAPETRGHGVPDVMNAVITKGGYIKSSLVFTKTIASALSIGSGGGAGREGPIVQIGASAGSAVGQLFNLSSDQLRTLVACGAAGGIAAIFNAPLGGVMFALEIIIGSFSVRQFSPIVVSAVIATAISRSYLGDHPTIVQTHYHLVSNYELFFYLLLGIAAGFISVGFTRLVYFAEDIFHRSEKRIPAVIMPALGGLGVGIMLIWLPSLAGFSYDINNQAILGEVGAITLIAVFILKPIAAGLTLGSGGSGGVFAPALKAGAAFGGAFGLLVNYLFPGATAPSGAYALVGMGALVAGTMHAPLTAIMIVFEISNTYEVILPIMFAAVSCAVIAKLLMKQSIYTLALERQGVEVGYGINLSIVHHITIASVMRTDYASVTPATLLPTVVKELEESDQSLLPVVDNGTLVGIIRFQDLRPIYKNVESLSFLIARDVMIQNMPTLRQSDTLDTALKMFEVADVETLPVIADDGMALRGILNSENAYRRYRKEIQLRSQ